MAGDFIQGAIKHPGSFTKKAKAAGMSVSEYAKKVRKKGSKADTTTKRQAALAQTLSKLRNKPTHGSGKLTMLGRVMLGKLQDRYGVEEGRKRFHGQIASGHLGRSRMFTGED